MKGGKFSSHPMNLQAWGGRIEAHGKRSMSMCQSKEPCCAHGNPSGRIHQTMHSTVDVSTAFPITRSKNLGPKLAHSSPWSAKPYHQGGFFWFSKVVFPLPPSSCALEDPWTRNLPSGLPRCSCLLEVPAGTISGTLCQIIHK